MTIVIKFPRNRRYDKPDEEIIETLTELLEKAKSGELQSLVALTVGHSTPELSMKMAKGHAASLIGALHIACSKIAKIMDAVLQDERNDCPGEEEP